MKLTMEDYINSVLQHVPSGLLTDEYAQSIRRISSQLPLLSSGYFECWLGESQSRVDLNIAINRIRNENKAFVAYFESGTAHYSLASLENSIKKWSALDRQLWLFSQTIFLVYDIPDPRKQDIAPWYYISYNPFPLFTGDIELQTEVILAISTMIDEPFAFDLQHEWKFFFDNVSPAIHVNAIGFQANRQVSSLRVALLFSAYSDLCHFLEKNAWPGDVDDLHKKVKDIVGGCDLYGLTMDVNPALQAKVGIECVYTTPETYEKGYRRLTDALINMRLCTEAQQKAFLEWEGIFTLQDYSNEWSQPNEHKVPSYAVPITVPVEKGFKYIKILYDPGKPLTAKGYLGYCKVMV